VAYCVVPRIISENPDVDHHWVVRDYAGKLLKVIANKYDNTSNNITLRLLNTYGKALSLGDKSLPSIYGAISVIGIFGQEAVKRHLVPNVKAIAERVQAVLDCPPKTYDQLAAEKIQLITMVSQVERRQPCSFKTRKLLISVRCPFPEICGSLLCDGRRPSRL